MRNRITERFNCAGNPIGRHPLVTSCMSRVFNLPLSQPKYVFVWDVQVVIKFIRSQWRSTDTLLDGEISLKLCMLLSLIK